MTIDNGLHDGEKWTICEELKTGRNRGGVVANVYTKKGLHKDDGDVDKDDHENDDVEENRLKIEISLIGTKSHFCLHHYHRLPLE